MKKFILTPKYAFRVPVDVEVVSPDGFEGKGLKEVEGLEAWEGNRRTALGALFNVAESEAEPLAEDEAKDGPSIEIVGDLSKVRRIGRGMTKGSISVKGSAGLRLGEAMRGGRIIVEGNAGSWLGSRMRGGTIEVRGNAGDRVGAPLPGGDEGMRGGVIVVHGDAGDEAGGFMVGGLLIIDGSAGQFVGYGMRGGDILVRGRSMGRAGAGMRGGRIALLGEAGSILPSFTLVEVRPTVRIGEERLKGPLYLFQGDLNERGSGRLYVSKEANPQLAKLEGYLESL